MSIMLLTVVTVKRHEREPSAAKLTTVDKRFKMGPASLDEPLHAREVAREVSEDDGFGDPDSRSDRWECSLRQRHRLSDLLELSWASMVNQKALMVAVGAPKFV